MHIIHHELSFVVGLSIWIHTSARPCSQVLAAALRHRGLTGAKVVGDGIPGVVRYDADIAAMSFYRIKHLFTKLGLLSKPAMKPKPTMKPKPAATAGKPKPTGPSKPAATTGKPKKPAGKPAKTTTTTKKA